MQSQQIRILYRQGDQSLPVPRNFRGQLRGWYPTPDTITGTWRQPGMLPVEPEE